MRRVLGLSALGFLALAAACGDDTGTGGSGGSGGDPTTTGQTTSTSTGTSTSTSTSTTSTSTSTSSTTTSTSSTTTTGATTTTTGMGGAGGGMPAMETLCADGLDDDNDNDVDCADADCAMAAVCGSLVINEIDYDQPGADNAEFVELFNAGLGPIELSGVDLVLVNGSTLAVYDSIALSGTLPAGGYAVVASAGVTVDPQALVFALPASIQNGTGDAVALHVPAENVLLDALSYEALVSGASIGGMTFDVFEGALCPDSDLDAAPSLSLSRIPNGSDTNDNSVDFVGTTNVTPGSENVSAEICNNAIDDDGDMMVDCADPDCVASPFCFESDCGDGMDNDSDGVADCLDPDCDMAACNTFGSVCAAMVCTCPGGMVETACGDIMDNDCDGQIDCGDSDCSAAPSCQMLSVSGVDYPVIAQGGSLTINGAGFTGATAVSIGGIGQTFVVMSDTQIVINAVADSTPVGTNQPLIVTVNAAQSSAFGITPIRLQINETDADTPGTDVAEFVEISTGVPGVNLVGYSLVFHNGSVANDPSYGAFELNVPADANGLILVGNPGVVPTPAITLANGSLQNGADAVAVYQASASAWPNNTAISAAGMIDLVVYGTSDADDTSLLSFVLAGGQLDEGTSGTTSIQRCANGRFDLTRFSAVDPPTPGAATVTACP